MNHLRSQQFLTAGFPLAIMDADHGFIDEHSHEFFEMVYVRQGHGEHYIEGQAYPIKAGDLYVISPNERHLYQPVGNSRLRVVNVLWMPSVVEELLRASSFSSLRGALKMMYVEPVLQDEFAFAHRLHLSGSTAYRVEMLLDEMRRELIGAAPDCQILLRHLFCALLVLLSRAYNDQNKPTSQPQPKAASLQQDVVSHAIRYIEEHHREGIRVEDIAASLAVSPSRLAHIFKEHAGCGLIEYLHEFRIARACAALVAGDTTVGEIASSVGYSDLSFFHRTFRRRTACSPTQYRTRFQDVT